MRGGLLRFDHAEAHLLSRPRVVLGDELAIAVAEEVGRAVADIEDADLAVADRGHDHRAAHSGPLGVDARGLEHRRVGPLASALETFGDGSLDHIHGHNAGWGLVLYT